MAAERCAGHHTDGSPCKGWRKKGSIYCNRHLIGTKARANAAIRAEVMDMGLGDVDVDVDEIALRLLSLGVNRVTMLSAEYESLVAQVGLHEATVGETTVIDSEGDVHAGKEYIRGLSDAEFRERKLLIELVFKAKAANLGERELQLAGRTGMMMAEVLRICLSDPDLQLTQAQRAVFPSVARRVLGLETAAVTVGSTVLRNGEE